MGRLWRCKFWTHRYNETSRTDACILQPAGGKLQLLHVAGGALHRDNEPNAVHSHSHQHPTSPRPHLDNGMPCLTLRTGFWTEAVACADDGPCSLQGALALYTNTDAVIHLRICWSSRSRLSEHKPRCGGSACDGRTENALWYGDSGRGKGAWRRGPTLLPPLPTHGYNIRLHLSSTSEVHQDGKRQVTESVLPTALV